MNRRQGEHEERRVARTPDSETDKRPRMRERNALVKNRMWEICTSGSVRGRAGDIGSRRSNATSLRSSDSQGGRAGGQAQRCRRSAAPHRLAPSETRRWVDRCCPSTRQIRRSDSLNALRSRMVGGPVRARALGLPAAQLPAHSHADAGGISRVPRRTDDPSPCRCRRCCPRSTHSEGSSDHYFEAIHAASAPAAYASRRALPHAVQGSLPAGWLTFYQEGVEPSGSRGKVPELHAHPPLLSFSCRKDWS
jgi:hypothetical protein